ncbi:uncharacterized protein B0J16DRAFT_403176 [Fusarium flagelliforme]|uniref:uncharacterized protein n=1 Tax=Fusarium flagelliforme TaxID=2675880 RepID=UPI001E8D1C0E|nr:uncharacterized protein B0J16DRAFT_403176 [Fusarium flagelliforme]KAH7179870.1 hypothetical protein B0J16DRAFT_403176 [Fusarium flagelliforme]
MEYPAEDSFELTEPVLTSKISETLPPGSLSNDEEGLGNLLDIDSEFSQPQAATNLGYDTYNMPFMSTSMVAALPPAEINFDFSNHDVDFGVDWPQNETMDNESQFDLTIQQDETDAAGTWPFYAFDPGHEPLFQPSLTMPQRESTEAFDFDTFFSGMSPFQGPVGDQALGNCIETGAFSGAETAQLEGSNNALNQHWHPLSDWLTDFNNPHQNITIGEIPADSTLHSNDAIWSLDLRDILDASSEGNTNVAPRNPHDTLSHQNGPTFDGESARPILSVPSGAPTQELHPHLEPSLAAPIAEMHLSVAGAAPPMGSFRPVRPVTLPPLRRGGNKGPLSAQERRARKEVRRRGVCIRCRRLKEKCIGGLPCEPCLRLSKATLWISPCAVANFHDIVKLHPYFLRPSSYALGEQSVADVLIELIGSEAQQNTLQNLDKGTVAKACRLVFTLWASGADRRIQVLTLAPYNYCALVNWAAAADILVSMLEKANENDRPMTEHLSQIADLQSEPSSWHQQPILIPDPTQNQQNGENMDLYLIFCAFSRFKFMPWNNPLSPVPDEEATDVDNKTLHILTWISKRRLEQELFRWLQGCVNKLNTLSPSQLSFIATLMLRVLMFGSPPLYLKIADADIKQMPAADLSTRHQVRQSLFCYLKIVIDKLPAWSDFWKEQTERIVPISPEMLRLSLSDLEVHDKRLWRMRCCYEQSYKFYETFGDIFEEAENTLEPDDMDDMQLARFIGSLVDGSYVSGAIKAVIPTMDQFYQTKIREPLESIESAIAKGISPSHLSIIVTSKELLLKAEKEVEAFLKGLKEVAQRWDGSSRGDADITAEFDLIDSIPFTSISTEDVATCSDVLGSILGSAEAGTH